MRFPFLARRVNSLKLGWIMNAVSVVSSQSVRRQRVTQEPEKLQPDNYPLKATRVLDCYFFLLECLPSSDSSRRSLAITARRIGDSGAGFPVHNSHCANPCAKNISAPEMVLIPFFAAIRKSWVCKGR